MIPMQCYNIDHFPHITRKDILNHLLLISIRQNNNFTNDETKLWRSHFLTDIIIDKVLGKELKPDQIKKAKKDLHDQKVVLYAGKKEDPTIK